MMKKGLLMVLAALIALPGLVRAEEGALKTKPVLNNTDKKMEKVEKMETVKANMEARQAERQEKRSDRVSTYLEMVVKRITQTLTQLEGLMGKADKYMGQLAAQGVDVSKARTAQAEAKTAWEAAKAALADLPSKIGSPANADKLTVAEAKTVRTAVENVTKLTKTAAQKVQELIKSLRGLMPKPTTTSMSKEVAPADTTTPSAPTTETAPERIN